MDNTFKYKEVVELVRSSVRRSERDARILLFGSRARGTARKDSDWDVVVLLNRPSMSNDERGDISFNIWESGQAIGEEINAFVYTDKQWESAPPSLFKFNVQQEAIEL